MIDILQNLAFTKPDKYLPSIKILINQCNLAFTLALSPLANKKPSNKSQYHIQNTQTGSDDSFVRSGKLTKALPHPFIFINGKNPSID